MPKKSEKDPAGSKDFKDRISPLALQRLAGALMRATPAFPEDEFMVRANAGLAALELKARVLHVADALAVTLPEEFPEAAAVIGRALESPDFDGWVVYPVNDFVARYGIDYPEVSLPLIARLTSRWSCEFAIRPFIETHPVQTFAFFDRWIESPDEHLRRLVSEGSRPRLPWGAQLKGFIGDPSPTIALLDRLVDDPSLYVRKSVANHLNDISKDHPDLAISTARRWLECGRTQQGAEPERREWIVRRGMRSLIKAGDPEALSLIGFDSDAPVELSGFSVIPKSIKIGDTVSIEFRLSAAQATPVMVDYRVHHAGANGTRSPKVFKLKALTLEPGTETTFRRDHAIREVSVRRIYPGPHLVEVQVNGRVLGGASVEVRAST